MEIGKTQMLVLVLLFSVSANAQSISNYTVSDPTPINSPLSIYGVYSGGTNPTLCDFYIYWADNNELQYRATSQYTSGNGVFGTTILTKNPTFIQGQKYRAYTVCGTASADANFTIGFERGQDHQMAAFIRNWQESPFTYAAIFILLMIVVAFAIAWVKKN